MSYYHLKIYNKQDPMRWEWISNLSREILDQRLLAPYREGREFTLRGRTTRLEDIDRITIDRTEIPWGDENECTDVTDELITGPPGSETAIVDAVLKESRPLLDTGKVFVVHGRNETARNALFSFLRSIGLNPHEWSEAVKAVGHPTPYIGEILDAAFSCAHAVVVLFTPDDIARLQEQFRSDRDPRHEVEPTGQARPNVLFEAGMAMGRDSNRTILVEMGKLRPFSDIAGRHIIRLDGSSKQRQQLAQRLRTAGCPVNLDGTDWHTEGNFDEALKVANSSWESAVAVDDPQLATAARSLLEEAARDDDRMIRIIRTAGGQTIRTHGKEFGRIGDPESEANFEGALGDLLERGLVKRKNGKDHIFLVTREGFRTAQKSSNGEHRPEQSTLANFRRAAHLQSKAVGESIHEREDQAFINAVTDFDDA